MKKIKKLLKSKRGIALENAIIFLIATFSLCALLTTFSLIGRYQTNIENTMLQRKAEVEQIGEDFLAEDLKEQYEDYTYEISQKNDSEKTLKVYHTSNSGNILLYVEVNGSTVVKWVYEPSEAYAATIPETTTITE